MTTSGIRAIENDALIESSFRRLLAAIESEREKIRSTWQQIEQERDSTTSELERLRQDTEDWCYSERQKIDGEWRRLDKLSERMSGLWPEATEVLEINCSGAIYTIPRSTLCSIEGSQLNQMFSDAFIGNIPRDAEGRLYLDFNPHCFGIVVEYLQNRRLRADVPVPIIPWEQQESMDMMAESLKLKPFLRINKVNEVHGTSLQVASNMVQATHPGWQVISAVHPLPMAGHSYVEVRIISNPNIAGGLAIGVCGHIPTGTEVHTIRLTDSVLYNSNNGPLGDCLDAEDLVRELKFEEGSVLGIKNDMINHALVWYYNHKQIGTVVLKEECIERMKTMYPVFALYVPGQRIKVDFNALPPSAGAMDVSGALGMAGDRTRLR